MVEAGSAASLSILTTSLIVCAVALSRKQIVIYGTSGKRRITCCCAARKSAKWALAFVATLTRIEVLNAQASCYTLRDPGLSEFIE